MKNRIIIFPGNMDSIFFLNEIDYIIQKFDSVYVFTYKGDVKRYNDISREKNIQYNVIKDISCNSIIRLINEIFLAKNKDIIYEIHKAWKRKGKLKTKIKRIGYILFYVSYMFNTELSYRNIISDTDEDTLYSFWLSRGAYACAYLKDKYHIKKSIARAHRFDLYEERNDLDYLPFRKFIYKNIDKLCFISEHGYQYFIEKYKCNVQKLSIYPLGTSNVCGLIKKIQSKNFVMIASCSNIVPVKRLDLIIDILSCLDIPFKWMHIGDGEKRKEIQEYAEKKLKRDDFFFMGSVDNQSLLNIYIERDVDYLINMSDSEGIPVSMMEAFSIGIPVICRNIGGCSEIVSNDCGLLLEEKNCDIAIDIQKVRDTLKIRLVDMELYSKMSNVALERWKAKFNSEKNYNEFTEMLIKI